MTQSTNTCRVLLVEDNPGDAELTADALADSSWPVQLQVARDGVEAVAMLEDGATREQLPDLVLMDLNLPGLSGFDVLSKLKSTPAMRRIPVVVLSSSTLPSDVGRTYDLGASSYVTKPDALQAYQTAIQSIERYWLGTVSLPTLTV